MPNFVLDQNASDINDAINRAHNPNTAPTDGVTDKFVTSDGIYQALDSIGPTNFADASLIESTDTWESSNGKLATTAAIAAKITADFTATGVNVKNTSDAYQDTALSTDNFFKSTHFSGNGGWTGSFGDFTETTLGNGEWEAATAGFYAVQMSGTFNDTSATNHNIYLRRNGFRVSFISNHTSGTKTHVITAFIYLNVGDNFSIHHDKYSGSGGVFRYRNAELQVLRIG